MGRGGQPFLEPIRPPLVPVKLFPRPGLDVLAEPLPESLFVFLRVPPSAETDAQVR
jgi:hypothetical protein